MCKSFVMEEMPQAFDIDRASQIQMLNKSSGYFTERDEIDSEDFAESVLEKPAVIETFNTYKDRYKEQGYDAERGLKFYKVFYNEEK